MDTFPLRMFQMQVGLNCEFFMLADAELQSVLPDAIGLDGPRDARVKAWAAIQAMLTSAANIAKACWGSRGKKSAERKLLRDSIDIDESSPLKAVVLRNHFEHFDERIEEWWQKTRRHNWVDTNIGPEVAITHGYTEDGHPPKDILRNFDPLTGELIFWEHRFNLYQVRAEIQRIFPMVKEEASKPHWID